jgi:hypothetical protein
MTRNELVDAIRDRMDDITDIHITHEDFAVATVDLITDLGLCVLTVAPPLPLQDGFPPEDYAFTAELLRRHMNGNRDLFQATASNNLNIILSALDRAAEAKP